MGQDTCFVIRLVGIELPSELERSLLKRLRGVVLDELANAATPVDVAIRFPGDWLGMELHRLDEYATAEPWRAPRP